MYHYVKNDAESLHQVAGEQTMTRLRHIDHAAPFQWLRDGWQDMQACGFRSLVFGLFFMLMGHGIDQAHSGNPSVALGLSAAFLFVGPFLSMGIYELSRQIQSGERPDLLLSLFSWCRNPGGVGRFAFYLSVVLLVWLWLSSSLVSMAGEGFSPSLLLISLLWAALAFMVLLSSALAIPLLLDRTVSASFAVATSIRGFRRNPGVMAQWYLIVALAVMLSLALQYWPLLIIGPWLGHATWRAYQQCVVLDEPMLDGTAGNL